MSNNERKYPHLPVPAGEGEAVYFPPFGKDDREVSVEDPELKTSVDVGD